MGHIIKPLLHSRLMPFLVALQVAIACAIACNALFLLQQRMAPIFMSHAINQPQRLVVVSQVVARGEPWAPSELRSTVRALQAIPGVRSSGIVDALPLITQIKMAGEFVGVGVHTKASAAVYVGTDTLKTLGLKLVAGRDFTPDENAANDAFDNSGPVIITQALARRLFPDGHALGQTLRKGGHGDGDPARYRVVGIVAHLMRNDFASHDSVGSLDNAALMPGMVHGLPITCFAIRVGSGDAQTVLKAARKIVQRGLGPRLMQGLAPKYAVYATLRHDALAPSRAAVWLLGGVMLVVLLVVFAGIAGLTNYWVEGRTRQIGIRRALGARRSHILREIRLENLLVVGLGVVVGLVAAYGINLWLMRHYELSRLPWTYLPVGAVLLVVLGQLGVTWPARRAAGVPPVVATRSV